MTDSPWDKLKAAARLADQLNVGEEDFLVTIRVHDFGFLIEAQSELVKEDICRQSMQITWERAEADTKANRLLFAVKTLAETLGVEVHDIGEASE